MGPFGDSGPTNAAAGRLAAGSTMALCAEQPLDPKQEIFIRGFLRSSTEPLKLPHTPLQATLCTAGLCWVFGFQSLAGSSEHPVLSNNLRRGLYGIAIATEPLLKTLTALLPCLPTVAKLFQTHHSLTRLQEPSSSESRPWATADKNTNSPPAGTGQGTLPSPILRIQGALK